ncbi:MAG: CpsD/CapB family tyrosine-protein kinase [Gammaproteobacteria bacterium]|nr:CpsD/CapB family tyrosine-protein kinase [Gammaproteobacteria bacterium]
MEHIRKALEQAEKDRAEVRKQADSGVFEAKQPAVQAAAEAAVPATAEIRYKSTKVVEVPDEVLERNRLIAALPNHELRDSYRMLRTRVLQQMTANGWNALAITSPATGHGKSLTAVNLAISLASEVNHTVLLADLDLRSPSVHSYFGYEPQVGLSDYLEGDVPLSEVLFSPGIDRLVVLPGREPVMNSSEMLSSPKMVSLVSELKSRYPDRLVICDLPPLLATDDALAFTPYTDGMLMVVEAGTTQSEDFERSLDILKDVPLVGTVLNRSETAARAGHYGYGRT